MTAYLRQIRPVPEAGFQHRFETASGEQAQVDFAQFKTPFGAEPGVERVVWLFSLVLGHNRWLWGRFGLRQDLATVLRCDMAAIAALGGNHSRAQEQSPTGPMGPTHYRPAGL